MKYVIHKRINRGPCQTSYDGPTWDKAQIRHLRQETYDDKKLAESIAKLLSCYNRTGFTVGETSESQRYWISFSPLGPYAPGRAAAAIVDECVGGEIIYFMHADTALWVCQMMNDETTKKVVGK